MTERGVRPRRVLIFAEAVTLAHVARPLCFARGLAQTNFHVTIAASTRVASHIRAEGLEHLELNSIEPKAFLATLARGKKLYDSKTLIRYVEDDLVLMDRFKPDLVVGDFRLSLSVSARLANVPYVTISSAY